MNTRYRLVHRGIRGGMYYCFDKVTGKRAIQEYLLDPLAMKLLDGGFKAGDQITATADGDQLKFTREK